MTYAIGSLIKARNREWVVLPDSDDDLLMVRPLGGTDDEIMGILTALETVESATFRMPDPATVGDHRSCRLLRDAVRLGFRSSAGPFRSFGRIAVEPRPYQLVPLLMALKMDPVRLLIADDVGIGKTVEAALIARELLDRGEISRFTVLCPPHLAEQWQAELKSKFHIDAELVLAGTAARLERRRTHFDQTVFDLFPFTIVSTDFIKAERRLNEFLRTCPELVIVDEAHTCAWGGAERGNSTQHRFNLIKKLSELQSRHIVLVTATPHSGNEEAFRSLLGLLRPEFAHLPADLAGPAHEATRRQLAQHLVQRRRGDILHYIDSDTIFPKREEREETYNLSTSYRRLFDRVLVYARETVADTTGGVHKQRIRWWSALSLLRSLASSPAAAAETLRTRAHVADIDEPQAIDDLGRQTVMDLAPDDLAQVPDTVAGSDTGEGGDTKAGHNRRLLEMAREADELAGEHDNKLSRAIEIVRSLLKDGYQPIVFCRFIPTAEYVAAKMRERLGKGVDVAAVTGRLPAPEREERVMQLAASEKRVLVCTDCLSEGVNLQQCFNAVIHYDLSWNPTRHEQREGRVDRYGQQSEKVRVLTYYSKDTQVDGIVLEVLIRKHHSIRSDTGVSVPAPADTNAVVEAIMEGLILRGKGSYSAGQMSLFDDDTAAQRDLLNAQWEHAADREKRSRTIFAQETIKVDAVAGELRSAREAVGSHIDVARFLRDAVTMGHGAVSAGNAPAEFSFDGAPRALVEAAGGEAVLGKSKILRARYEMPIHDGELLLTRTHPIVEGIASYVLDTSLDSIPFDDQDAQAGNRPSASRCGVIRTGAVSTRTTVLLLRLRYHIITRRGDAAWPLLAEDLQTVAFEGRVSQARWLEPGPAETLLTAVPAGNMHTVEAQREIQKIVDGFAELQPEIDRLLEARGHELLTAHRRVRDAARQKGLTYHIEPQRPADVLGIFVLLPSI